MVASRSRENSTLAAICRRPRKVALPYSSCMMFIRPRTAAEADRMVRKAPDRSMAADWLVSI